MEVSYVENVRKFLKEFHKEIKQLTILPAGHVGRPVGRFWGEALAQKSGRCSQDR
jgi:hypothetical protein